MEQGPGPGRVRRLDFTSRGNLTPDPATAFRTVRLGKLVNSWQLGKAPGPSAVRRRRTGVGARQALGLHLTQQANAGHHLERLIIFNRNRWPHHPVRALRRHWLRSAKELFLRARRSGHRL